MSLKLEQEAGPRIQQKSTAGGQLQPTIRRQVGLDEAVEALPRYKGKMTAGKILIKLGL